MNNEINSFKPRFNKQEIIFFTCLIAIIFNFPIDLILGNRDTKLLKSMVVFQFLF
nr:hypothetical protein DMDDKFKA_00150 [Haslea ostrearia]